MDIADQFDFVCAQLAVCCQLVDIDLEISRDALAALAMYSDDRTTNLADLCKNAETLNEAQRLLTKFNSKEGYRVLYNLGKAWSILDDRLSIRRNWEDEFEPSDARSFCDFALQTGAAYSHCFLYANEDKPSKRGGQARAMKYKVEAELAISLFRSMTGVSSMSADEAAGHIMGKPGVSLSHRKISEIIRKERKIQSAKHNARDS